MAKKRPLVEFILQVINLVFTVWGLGTLGYGLVCFFKWKHSLSKEIHHEDNAKYMIVHRLFLAIDPPHEHLLFETLPKAWFIYLIIGIGAILLIVSCFGYIGTATRSPCCLLTYCVFLVALIIVELGTAAFIFFKHNWKKVIPKDRSGSFHRVYHFVNVNWKVIRWVALGVFILQVIAMIITVYLRSVYNSAWYDRSDDEQIVELPNARIHNYKRLAPTTGVTLSTTTSANAREPTKPIE